MGCDACASTVLFPIRRFQSTQPEWAATYLLIVLPPYQSRFQSTQPEWAATFDLAKQCNSFFISIHAARVGCDGRNSGGGSSLQRDFNPRSPSGLRRKAAWMALRSRTHFNPRSPSGLRPQLPRRAAGAYRDFNPRSPSGLRLAFAGGSITPGVISIHAARVGCDPAANISTAAIIYFNPRSPSGLRQYINAQRAGCRNFNPRSPSGLRPGHLINGISPP